MHKRSDGRWREKITENGKTKYIYANTKSELIKKIREYDFYLDNGELFETVAAEWKEEHFKTLSPNSQKPYNGAFNRAIRYFEGQYIRNIESDDIRDLIEDMKREGLAKKTVATQILVLNLIFKFARLNKFTKDNPCEFVEVPKNLKKTKREMPSEKDIQKIIDAVDTDPFGLFFYFLYYTGCRYGEALALIGEDIDLKAGELHITKSLYYDHHGAGIKEPKTESGTRIIPIPDCLKDKLPKLKPHQYLFSHLEDRSKPFPQNTIYRWCKKYKERVGITCTPHQLRHGYATLLYDAGLTAKDAQQFLGHSTIEMTQDIYTHITASRSRINATMLNDFINRSKLK